MGKTSIAELENSGNVLRSEGWVFLFTDVEGATCPEDVIAEIAQAAHPVRALSSRFAVWAGALLPTTSEEINALDFRREDPRRAGCRKLAASRGATTS